MNMTYVLKLTFLLYLNSLFLFSFSQDVRPKWVLETPNSDKYYYGVGHSNKSHYDYQNIAKHNALSSLAEGITVYISSERTMITEEINYEINEKYEELIKVKTTNELKDYEIDSIWQNEDEYWVLYNLSKKDFYDNKVNEYSNALSAHKSSLGKAQDNHENGKYMRAVEYYLNSTSFLEEQMHDNFIKDLQNDLIQEFFNSVYAAQDIISNLEFRYDEDNFKAKKGIDQNVSIDGYVINRETNKYVENIPVKYKYFDSNFRPVINWVYTQYDGSFNFKVPVSRLNNDLNEVKVYLDLEKILDVDNKESLASDILLDKLNTKQGKYNIYVSSPRIYINTKEKVFDSESNAKLIEPFVKKLILRNSFNFTGDRSRADYIINIDANTKKSSQNNGLYIVFLDATLTIENAFSENTISYKTYSNIKGVMRSYNDASAKAYKQFLEELEDDLPDELNRIYDQFTKISFVEKT